MKSHTRFLRRCLLHVVFCGALLASVAAQQTTVPNLELQRQAMKRLAPLVGKWSGGVRWFTQNTTIELNFTDDVHYEQNGLVLRTNAWGRRFDGHVVIGSTQVISYDDQSGIYRIHLPQDKREGSISIDEDGQGMTIDFPTPQRQTTRARLRINEEGYLTLMHWVTEESDPPWMFLAGILHREQEPAGQRAGSNSQNADTKKKTE